jgi:hypothetical protein
MFLNDSLMNLDLLNMEGNVLKRIKLAAARHPTGGQCLSSTLAVR